MSTILKNSKRSICIVVSMIVTLLCFTAIPASADSYTLPVGSTPVGFEIMTTGYHTISFSPASVAYTITFKSSPNGSVIGGISVPASVSGMPGTLTTTINFPNQQVYWVTSTRATTIYIS